MTHQSHTCYTNAASKTAVSVIVQGSVVMQLMWVAIHASAITKTTVMIMITIVIMMTTTVMLFSS